MLPTLAEGAQQLGLSLSESQLAAFERYRRELISWNERANLTRIIEPEAIVVKHFLDSLSVYPVLSDLSGEISLIDVGSGAGFPGLPLKIVRPYFRLTLLESAAKKTAFLAQVVQVLKLRDTVVLTARAEEAGRRPEYREQYDVAVARAVSGLPVLAEYALPLVKVGGRIIAQKGQDPATEVKAAAHALAILGGRVDRIEAVTVPGLEAARHLVVIQKQKPTPEQYPRRPGMPAKRPLL